MRQDTSLTQPPTSAPRSIRTNLNLLTRDGSISMTFAGTLSPAQYEEIFDCVSGVEDAAAMRECISHVAAKWGVEVIFDGA